MANEAHKLDKLSQVVAENQASITKMRELIDELNQRLEQMQPLAQASRSTLPHSKDLPKGAPSPTA
jgi:uncharacterized coiled-coil protein SlyX